MRRQSRSVSSNQQGVHPDLEELVRKHLQTRFSRPFAGHTLAAFDSIRKQVAVDGRPLIFDSGCGVGESSVKLAAEFPDHLVIGIDQSEHRLQKNPCYQGRGPCDNLILVRADCVDLWRLAEQEGWQLARHYILYPNPWPKKSHVKRRWHAHPVFRSLLELGGRLEVRSNWPLYIEEFAEALWVAGIDPVQRHDLQLSDAADFLTPFERKYAQSGQALYTLVAESLFPS